MAGDDVMNAPALLRCDQHHAFEEMSEVALEECLVHQGRGNLSGRE